VVPVWATPVDASSRRRAARGLAVSGRARAVYLRTPDVCGRWVATLHLTTIDSPVTGDAYPLHSPRWVTPPPLSLLSLSCVLQAAVLESFTGTEVSPSTAARFARECRSNAA